MIKQFSLVWNSSDWNFYLHTSNYLIRHIVELEIVKGRRISTKESNYIPFSVYDVRHAQQLESIYRNTITIVIMWSVSRKCQQRRSAVIQYIIQIDALCAREKIKTYNTCDPGTCVYSKWRRISFRYAFRWKTLPHFLYRSIAYKNIINNLFSDFLFCFFETTSQTAQEDLVGQWGGLCVIHSIVKLDTQRAYDINWFRFSFLKFRLRAPHLPRFSIKGSQFPNSNVLFMRQSYTIYCRARTWFHMLSRAAATENNLNENML